METPPKNNPAQSVNGLTEAFQNATMLNVLAGAALQPEEVKGYHFATVPNSHTHKDITDLVEKAQPTPNRKRGTVALKDVASLLAYCADQCMPASGYIYADPDARRLTAVFNDHRAALLPGWRDHRAEFKAEYTPEFDNWLRHNKQPKSQTEFAEFIEDNLADITEPAAAQLMEVATTMQAKTGINFSSSKRLDNGQVQLEYTETIDARAGAGGALQIPKEFALGLRIFKNGSGYRLKARLKYRLSGGAVKFWYELDRPEKSVEDAFAGYVEAVRQTSGYTVLIGTP